MGKEFPEFFDMNRVNWLILFVAMAMAACAKLGTSNETAVTSCDNSFVVAGNYGIKLFEHELGSVTTRLVRDISVPKGGAEAYYLCGRKEIVSVYANRGAAGGQQDQGIEIYTPDGRMENFRFEEGAGNLIPYRDGLLFDTWLLHKEPINSDVGFLSRHEQAANTALTAGSYVFGDAKGKAPIPTHHVFTWMHFFDLNQRKVIRSYRRDISFGDWLVGDTLTSFGSTVVSMDLITGRRTGILEPSEPIRNQIKFDSRGGVFLRTNDQMYAVASASVVRHSIERLGRPRERLLLPLGVAPSKPSQCKCMTVYEMDETGGFTREKIRLPYDDISYALDKGEFIYLFTRASGKVLRYNTRTNKFEEIPFDTGGKAVIAATYTVENFVLVLAQATPTQTKAIEERVNYNTFASLVVVSADFMQRSQPIDLGWVNDVYLTSNQRPQVEGRSGQLHEFDGYGE